MTKLFSRLSIIATVLVTMAACTDGVTEPRPKGSLRTRATPLAEQVASAELRYYCLTSVRTGEGNGYYRYGRLQLSFPAGALAGDGASMPYRYRAYAEGEVVMVANCVIPRTDAAVRFTEHKLGVKRSKQSAAPGSDGEIGTMDLPPDTVRACRDRGLYPHCYPPDAPICGTDQCGSGGTWGTIWEEGGRARIPVIPMSLLGPTTIRFLMRIYQIALNRSRTHGDVATVMHPFLHRRVSDTAAQLPHCSESKSEGMFVRNWRMQESRYWRARAKKN
ncbi:MAG: hypothetical protein WKF55_13105 [Gemmatimonadaceae bacterium]